MFPDLEGLDFRSPLYITKIWIHLNTEQMVLYFMFCNQIINIEQKVWVLNVTKRLLISSELNCLDWGHIQNLNHLTTKQLLTI